MGSGTKLGRLPRDGRARKEKIEREEEGRRGMIRMYVGTQRVWYARVCVKRTLLLSLSLPLPPKEPPRSG